MTSYATIRHALAIAVVLTDPIRPDAKRKFSHCTKANILQTEGGNYTTFIDNIYTNT
jgi:hypothetical protein